MKKAIYAFSADPITLGHVDIIRRAARIFDQVVVAIGVNPDKKYLFSLKQRMSMAEKALQGVSGVQLTAFRGLLVDFAREQDIQVIVKGVRSSSDLEYEINLYQLGETQDPDVDTFFLPARQNLEHISSSGVKAVQKEQGFVQDMVPLFVKQCLEGRMKGQYILGLTGPMGAGKSFIGRKLMEVARENHLEAHHVEYDYTGHEILGSLTAPYYRAVREELIRVFGPEIRGTGDTINRKALGQIVFNHPGKLEQLNEILARAMRLRLRKTFLGKKGLIIFNAALIAESNLEFVSNNNVILVNADRETQRSRLLDRELTLQDIEKRLESQFSGEEKSRKIETRIRETGQGCLWKVDNSRNQHIDFPGLLRDIVGTLDLFGELRFKALYNRLGIASFFETQYSFLRESYAGRSYHNMENLLSLIQEIDSIRTSLFNSDIVECALWYGRIIYDSKIENSVEQSAQYAYNLFHSMGLDSQFCTKVANYIHCLESASREELRDDAPFVVDLVNSVLGWDWKRFMENEKSTREEFEWMPREEFRQRRFDYYRELYARERIYLTDWFHRKYEAAARRNIEKILEMVD